MDIIKCVITDDEKTAREGLRNYLEKIPYLKLTALCKSAIELDEVLLSEEVDLVFLDIQMPGITGLEWLKHSVNPPKVIFTTAHREFALEGFELSVIDYLLKPISFARFSKACSKAHQILSKTNKHSEPVGLNENERHIFIKEDNQTIKIFLKDILYFEAAVDYIYIHTAEKRYMTLFSMKLVEQQMTDSYFMRIHRSFIINTRKVRILEGKQVVIGDAKLPISRTLYNEVYDKLVSNNLWKE